MMVMQKKKERKKALRP